MRFEVGDFLCPAGNRFVSFSCIEQLAFLLQSVALFVRFFFFFQRDNEMFGLVDF